MISRFLPPRPPSRDQLPLINADSRAARWLDHYWRKLGLPPEQAQRLALTDDRREFAHWTGRRLNTMALGCYCYLPLAQESAGGSLTDLAITANLTAPSATPGAALRGQLTLPGFEAAIEASDVSAPLGMTSPDMEAALEGDYRHLIFVEPELLPDGVEVTIAHELIHLADRVSGRPRKHRCHGHDSISVDEAALTGRDPEWLRELLAEETRRREEAVRQQRPYKYLYVCPNCGKNYPRVRKYSRNVSCGHCDQRFNVAFLLQLRAFSPGEAGGQDRADHQVAQP